VLRVYKNSLKAVVISSLFISSLFSQSIVHAHYYSTFVEKKEEELQDATDKLVDDNSKNSLVQEHSKFTDEQIIVASLARLYKQCENTKTRKAPKQMVIDAARVLVNADDAYKAKASRLKTFLFLYPAARDAGIFASGCASGILGFWLFT